METVGTMHFLKVKTMVMNILVKKFNSYKSIISYFEIIHVLYKNHIHKIDILGCLHIKDNSKVLKMILLRSFLLIF